MSRKLPRPWSRAATSLGVLACLGSVVAWYYGLPLAVALLALLFGVIGRLRGEHSFGALFWPLSALVLGTVVYLGYLYYTDVNQDAAAVIDENFDDGFDDNFRDLVGDGDDGFGAPQEDGGTVSGAEDAGVGAGAILP